jgi:hypothetical protein
MMESGSPVFADLVSFLCWGWPAAPLLIPALAPATTPLLLGLWVLGIV